MRSIFNGMPLFIAILCMHITSGCERNWREDEALLQEFRKLEEQVEANPQDLAALRKIIAYADDRHFITRGNAIVVLGNIGVARPELLEEHVMPYLKKGLHDKDAGVRRGVASVFSDLPSDALQKCVPDILSQLKIENEDISQFLIQALGKAGAAARPAVPQLIATLLLRPPPGTQEEAPQLRVVAAEALGRIGPPAANEAVPALRRGLGESSPYFRIAAAKALLKLQPADEQARGVLDELSRSSDKAIRDEALSPSE